MVKISLKDWVILLTILPTTIIGLGLASYFSYSRHIELNEVLKERVHSIIKPIALSSYEYMSEDEKDKLTLLISDVQNEHSKIIRNIVVFQIDNQIFATTKIFGDELELQIDPDNELGSKVGYIPNDDYLIVRAPILTTFARGEQQSMQLSNKPLGYVAMHVDKSYIKFSQQNQVIISFAIVLLGILLSSLFSFKLISNVTRPISSMVGAIDRIREGKLESRVSGNLIGELNFLKNGVNAMAQSLGDYRDEMQRSIDQATIDLRESLEQFEIQNVELDIAKRKAQDANRVKSEFLANMSHELRTPLNGVIGFTRQVLKTPLSETQRDYLQTIERSAKNLLAIINDILDFSKLDAGKMVIENIPFSIRDTIEETITLLAPSAHKKNIELSLRVSPHMPDALIGDAMRIKQVIINLANNAIKFTDKGSVNIDLDFEQSSPQVVTLKASVSDTGIGMTQEQQDSIFEAFSQADKSVTRLYGGTGLGLVISQRLAHEMNGDIGFTSEENRGSTFWFTCQCETNSIVIEHDIVLPSLQNKSVLYFESNTHSRIATSEIMANWHMEVKPVKSLEQLSNVLASEQTFDYALIGHNVTPAELSDLKELITSISPKINSVHVAINSNSPNIQETLIASGAKSCLSKPLTAAKLSKTWAPQSQNSSSIEMGQPQKKVPIKVLAVDDNEANLKLIKALLLEQVDEVAIASNGQDALSLCQSEKFALIYMDIQMPVMDGTSALKAIKADTFNDETPIIAVTAHALTGEKEKLLELGFSAYMTKPIDETMLRHTIYEYCDIRLYRDDAITNMLSNVQKKIELEKESKVVSWSLALKRANNNESLAKEMLRGLVHMLNESIQNIESAIKANDCDSLKSLIHKINGACCYTGVPKLAEITHHIETELKKNKSATELEPEFLEFFEQIDQVLQEAPNTIKGKTAPVN